MKTIQFYLKIYVRLASQYLKERMLSPVIGAAFFLISCKIWEFFAEKYAGTGS